MAVEHHGPCKSWVHGSVDAAAVVICSGTLECHHPKPTEMSKFKI